MARADANQFVDDRKFAGFKYGYIIYELFYGRWRYYLIPKWRSL